MTRTTQLDRIEKKITEINGDVKVSHGEIALLKACQLRLERDQQATDSVMKEVQASLHRLDNCLERLQVHVATGKTNWDRVATVTIALLQAVILARLLQ